MNRKYIVGAVVVALIIAAALIVVSVTGGDDGALEAGELEDVALVQDRLRGIPQSDNTLGQADAPVEIVEFGDLQCPACASSSERTLPELVERYIRPGEAKITFVPIAFIGEDSERGALGAEAASRQDAMWPFIEVLYHNQGGENSGWLTDATMRSVVEALGLDLEQWNADYSGDEVATAFFEAAARAEEAGVNSTPTFVVTGPEGRTVITGAAEIGAFEEAIADVSGG